MPPSPRQEKKKKEDKISAWRAGYDAGVKNIMYQNKIALQLGEAILDALDSRYEFKKENYD